MKITSAMLCDAATVREGLVHILGGGITRLLRPSYPAPLGATLALQVQVLRSEVEVEHVIDVRVFGPTDKDEIAHAQLKVGAQPGLKPDEIIEGTEAALPVIIPLGPLVVPTAGDYKVVVRLDRKKAAELPLHAEVVTH